MSQHNDQLFNIISYSYSEYIHAQLELLTNSLYFSTIYFDEETFSIQKGLKDIYLTLPSLLSSGSFSKEACATKLLCYREILEKKYRVLIAYQRELTHLVTVKQHHLASTTDYLEELGLSAPNTFTFDYEKLSEDCAEYVFKNKDGTQIQKSASELLPHIPIKLTKDNYLDYCKKSITHIGIQDTVEAADHLTSILGQLFDGTTCPEYGNHFSDLIQSLEELTCLDNLTDLFEEANLLNETFETLIDMLAYMYKTICALSNLLLFDQLDFTDLTDMHVSFSDLYYSLKSIYSKEEDAELLLPSLKERLEDLTKELKKSLEKVTPTAQLNPHFNLMQTYLSMSLEQIFGFTTIKTSHYSSEVLARIDNFISTMHSQLYNLPIADRKWRMQYFISNIPFVMSKKSFKTYVEKSFTNLKTPEQGLLTALQLSNLLEQSGYFPTPKEEPIFEENFLEDDAAARFLAEHEENI